MQSRAQGSSFPSSSSSESGAPGASLRSIRVISNSYSITTLPKTKYQQYDVGQYDLVVFSPLGALVFTPEVSIRSKRIRLFHHLQTSVAPQAFNPRALYDGTAIAYAPVRLNLPNDGNVMYIVKLGETGALNPGSSGAYQIRLTKTKGEVVDPSRVFDLIRDRRSTNEAAVAINLAQLISRQGPNLRYTNNGRAYFTEDGKRPIRYGIELLRGIFQSVRPSPKGLILTIDTCTAAVYQSGQMSNVAMSVLGTSDGRSLSLLRVGSQDFRRLEAYFKKLRVKTKIGSKWSAVKTVHGLEERGGDYTFLRDGEEISIRRHFLEAHAIALGYPDWPGVRLTSNKAPMQVIVPMELCYIEPGQFYKKKLPEDCTRDVVKFATMNPSERQTRIRQGIAYYPQSEFVRESGMQISSAPIEVQAKLLDVPTVHFKNAVIPNNGSWAAGGQTLHSAMALEYWGIISFSRRFRQKEMSDMARSLKGSFSRLGMRVEDPLFQIEDKENDVKGTLDCVFGRKLLNKTKDNFGKIILFIVLPVQGGHIRNAVKYWGDVLEGVHTQCVKEDKMLKELSNRNSHYCTNIALKVNARLGGINFYTESAIMKKFGEEYNMIMGADIGHPGPGVPKPSVVGVVFSHDRLATQYAALTGIQRPRLETIEGLRYYVAAAFNAFWSKDNIPPRRLIFYRDGLSEGEFRTTAQIEREEIQLAIDHVWQERESTAAKPLVTYVIVGKRHHAVFFPRDRRDGDRTGNCPPGSLIDQEVTHPLGNDFYLQSHAAIQGTSRSGHYTVIYDEIWNQNHSLNEPWYLDELQELSFALCHVYARATRSVSIPAPVYYADLVCSRGAFHIQPGLEFSLDDNASVSSGSSSSTVDVDAWKKAFRPVHHALRYTMYFV